jgi:hypothetical protein
MAIQYPTGIPTEGDTFEYNGITFVFSDGKWTRVGEPNDSNVADLTGTIQINNTVDDRWVTFKNNVPLNDQGNGDTSGGEPWGFRYDIDAGNSGRNRVKVKTRLGDIVSVQGGTRPAVLFGTDFHSKSTVVSGKVIEVKPQGEQDTAVPTSDEILVFNRTYPTVIKIGGTTYSKIKVGHTIELKWGANYMHFKVTELLSDNGTYINLGVSRFAALGDFLNGDSYPYASVVHLDPQGTGDEAGVRIEGVPTPNDSSDPTAAVNKKYVDDNFLNKHGDNMEGALDMKGESGRNKIINLASPTSEYHASNRKYVDDLTDRNRNFAESVKDEIDAIEGDVFSDFHPRMTLMQPENFAANNYNKEMYEHMRGLFPEEDDLYYHNVEQRFSIHIRMYEGGKDKTDPYTSTYGNLELPSAMLYDTKTGKSMVLSPTNVSAYFATGSEAPVMTYKDSDGNDASDGYHALRGSLVIGREDGSCDYYAWINNPLAAIATDNFSGNKAAPLYRIHIPREIDDTNPFANILCKWTNIYCDELAGQQGTNDGIFPAENPYNENNSDVIDVNQKYPYEISPYSYSVRDTKDENRKHWFMMSHNKQSKDFVTFRTFHVMFDQTSAANPDEGSIVIVKSPKEIGEDNDQKSHKNGNFASGYPFKKKDIHGVERCFLFASPIGLTELYFRDTGVDQEREPIIRNYPDYNPNGPAQKDQNRQNDLGHDRIIGKGIFDNWFKNDQSNVQFLNYTPLDDNDRTTCMAIWFQGSYGICSMNLQDLGTVDRSDEVRLENNYKGDLNSLHIHHTGNINYRGYLEESSVKNLIRFASKLPETHANGSVFFFDYKDGYVNNNNEHWNDSRVRDANGNLTDYRLYKRGIIEVKLTDDEDIEIIAHNIGSKTKAGVEIDPSGQHHNHMNFSGETVQKVKGKFMAGSAIGSHSTIDRPQVYVFDPLTISFSLVKPYEGYYEAVANGTVRSVNAIGFTDFPHKELVVSTGFGKNRLGDPNVSIDDGTGTPLVMFEYGSEGTGVTSTRQKAAMVRALNDLAGSPIDGIGETWTAPTADPATTPVPTPEEPDFDAYLED